MSDTVNPYQSPETVVVPVKPLIAQGALTETMLIYLKGASPWLRFIGILGFVGAGTTALWGIVSFVVLPMMNNVWSSIPVFEEVFNDSTWSAIFGGSTAVLCIGTGVLMFFPSLFIYRFGERIRSYLRTGTEQDMEQAFKNNKSLWKFAGIICIIELAFIPLAIIVGIIVAIVVAVS